MVDNYGVAGVEGADGQNFELSFCRFFNYSRLRYSCRTHQAGSENKPDDRPNTFEVTKYLHGRYDLGMGSGFKNISLLFQFQGKSLCVTSSKKNVTTLKHADVKLPIDGTNVQHLLTCIKPQSQLERNYTFSCATNVDKMKELSLTVSGFDVDHGSVWTADLKLHLVHDCSIVDYENPDHDHKVVPPLRMMWGVSSGIAAVIGLIIFIVIFVKCYRMCTKHEMSRQQKLLITESPTGDSILLPVDADTRDTAQFHAVASDFQQTDSASVTDSQTSVHQQDDSSEDNSISSLPKAKCMIMLESQVEWMESPF